MHNTLYSNSQAQRARKNLLMALFMGLVVSLPPNVVMAKSAKTDADQDWQESAHGGELPGFKFKDAASQAKVEAERPGAVPSQEEGDQYFPGSALKYEYSNKVKEVNKLEEQEKQAT